MLFTAGDISEILSMSTEKTAKIILIFLKKEYLQQVGEKYAFTDEGRKYLEYLHENNLLK